ncbi:MAG: hypothetical protein ACKV2O_20475 [Acidimicrobiales bacterium]
MRQQWVTVEELQEAKAAMVAKMEGLVVPTVYAFGYRGADGAFVFPVLNHDGSHQLPAVVLAKVLGYRRGSRSYPMDLSTLDTAIEVLEPAGACAAYDHPNLWAWQQLREDIRNGMVPDSVEVVAVLLGDAEDPPGDEACAALRAAVHRERLILASGPEGSS